MKKIAILLALCATLVIGSLLLYREGSLPVNSKEEGSTIFVVGKGENLDDIINTLSQEKLIRNRLVFYLIVKRLGIERSIQAGDFRLSQSMSAEEVAQELTHGTIDVWVTIPEGFRKEEVAELMGVEFNIPETEFNSLAEEGFLFPDTYLIPKNPSAEQVITVMKNTFNTKYSKELQAKAREKGLTDLELVTLASIIEKEAFKHDKQEIANIIYKRLTEEYPLQIDATVQYALGYQPSEKRWWKKSVTFADLKYESPYNTYLNEGLPPGPIANPGLASLEAAANATDETPYFFYLHDSKGRTYYAETYEEHQKNIERYLR